MCYVEPIHKQSFGESESKVGNCLAGKHVYEGLKAIIYVVNETGRWPLNRNTTPKSRSVAAVR
jgi:hypothetical protein